MLNRRTFLLTAGALGALMGCPQSPPPPTFLSNLQLLTRDGSPLPERWTISIASPIDPTIQYQIVADHPLEHDGRKVVIPEEWAIVANVEHKGEQLSIGGPFRHKSWFGEEFAGTDRSELIWESPDCPPTIAPEVQWQWFHCRVQEPGHYTMVVYLLPTVIRIGGDDTKIDHGTGFEIVRKEFVVEDGERLSKGLTMSLTNGEIMPRSIHRKMRPRKKG